MWVQFILENAHFAISLGVALIFFAVFWLYFDAWYVRHTPTETVRLIGFFLISISFVVYAVYVESSIVAVPILSQTTTQWLLLFTRVLGYLLLVGSLLGERLEDHPDHPGKKGAVKTAAIMLAPASLLSLSYVAYPICAVIVGFLYLRRSTIGLEDHLKPMAYSFFLLSIAELLGAAALFVHTDIVAMYWLVAPFGPLWIAQHILLTVVALMLGHWVFGYLLKQFQTQLFMIFTTSILVIFLVTTVTFTGLLIKNIQDESLHELATDVNVLQFTLDSKKSELSSDAVAFSQNPQIIQAVEGRTRKTIADMAQDFLLAKKESSLIVTDDSGQVLARGENRDRAGDSLSEDPLVKRALLGESAVSVVTKDGVVAPEISLRAGTPILDKGKVVGVVLTGSVVDAAYVDGLKTATGLETVIYGDDQVSASTLTTPDGSSRLTGMKEQSSAIKTAVLTNGKNYTGTVTLLNEPYFASYLPLKDVDGTTVGMLFVGRPQISILQTAGRSIELTFLVTVLLLMGSIIPAYFVSRYIADQL